MSALEKLKKLQAIQFRYKKEFDNEFRFSALTKSIDETDTAIIGNDTKLHLVKEFIE